MAGGAQSFILGPGHLVATSSNHEAHELPRPATVHTETSDNEDGGSGRPTGTRLDWHAWSAAVSDPQHPPSLPAAKATAAEGTQSSVAAPAALKSTRADVYLPVAMRSAHGDVETGASTRCTQFDELEPDNFCVVDA